MHGSSTDHTISNLSSLSIIGTKKREDTNYDILHTIGKFHTDMFSNSEGPLDPEWIAFR